MGNPGEATPPKPEETPAESSSDAASEVEVRPVVQRWNWSDSSIKIMAVIVMTNSV